MRYHVQKFISFIQMNFKMNFIHLGLLHSMQCHVQKQISCIQMNFKMNLVHLGTLFLRCIQGVNFCFMSLNRRRRRKRHVACVKTAGHRAFTVAFNDTELLFDTIVALNEMEFSLLRSVA